MANGAPGTDHYYESKDYAEVLAQERPYVGLSPSEPIIGLSLSGGGIRSASFALGVMQALYSFGRFNKFNYLSTVSGGGYVGGALTYFRNTLGAEFNKLNDPWFPFGYEPPQGAAGIKTMGARAPAKDDPGNELARKIVAYLRQHASYMTPSREFGGPALTAGVLRGVISTLLPYFAILSGLFGVLVWIGFFDQRSDWVGLLEAPSRAPVSSEQSSCAAEQCQVLADCLGKSCPAAAACPPTACTALAKCAGESCAKPEKPAPAFYLAFVPAGIAGLLGAGLVFAFLVSSIIAAGNQSTKEAKKDPVKGYKALLWFYGTTGEIVVVASVLLVLSTLPWLNAYLNSLVSAASGLPANFPALLGAVGGAVALIGRLRSVIGGGTAKKPSMLRAIAMAVAGIVFLYGLLLLAYGVSTDLYGAVSFLRVAPEKSRVWNDAAAWHALWPSVWPVISLSAGILVLGIGAALLIHIDLATPHRIYRDRLMEIFCAEREAVESGEWKPAVTAQSDDGWLIKMNKQRRPYHLINTCLVATDSNKRRYRGRGGDNFILSPLFYGSDATGWVKAEIGLKQLSLPTAIAISGAALNAHAGPHGSGLLRNKAYAALLSLLGLNLGFWMRNPLKFKNDRDYTFYIPTLLKPGLRALFGRKLHETSTYVQLSDGGHFENLAIYELVRRRVDFLFISDAGQDVGFTFEDLANAIERVRVDFGVNLRFQHDAYDLSHLIPKSATSDNAAGMNLVARYELATRGYAIGTIEYPDASKGVVVYVKSTLTRHLPGDLYGYKARNNEYPHQTTLDQFFDEDQFEAYRELGYRLTARLFRDIEDAKKKATAPQGTPMPEALQAVADKLGILESSADAAGNTAPA
jgi:hypothetical protein